MTSHTTNLLELKKTLKSYGFKKASAAVATLSDFAKDNREVESISDDQYIAYVNQIQEEGAKILDAIRNTEDLIDYKDSFIFIYLQLLIRGEKVFHACGVGRRLVGISITGDIYPCHRFVGNEKFHLGNVKTTSPNSERQAYSKSFTKDHPVCSSCWAKYQCGGGGCIQDNEVTMSDVNNINTMHCTTLKMNLKEAIFIISELTPEERKYLFKAL